MVPVPDALVHAVRGRVWTSRSVNVWRRAWACGRAIVFRFVKAPLAGYSAVFQTHLSGAERARVLMQVLSREDMIELPRDHVVSVRF